MIRKTTPYVCNEVTAKCYEISLGLCPLYGKVTGITTRADEWTRSPELTDEVIGLVKKTSISHYPLVKIHEPRLSDPYLRDRQIEVR